jgi:hypothetical protein
MEQLKQTTLQMEWSYPESGEFSTKPVGKGKIQNMPLHQLMCMWKKPDEIRAYQQRNEPWTVKHKNGNRSDNAITNLEIIPVHFPVLVFPVGKPNQVEEYESAVLFLLSKHYHPNPDTIGRLFTGIREELKYKDETVFRGCIIRKKKVA